MSSWQEFWYRADNLLCNQPATQHVGEFDAFPWKPGMWSIGHIPSGLEDNTHITITSCFRIAAVTRANWDVERLECLSRQSDE